MAIKVSNDKQLREHVLYLLDGGAAHARFDDVAKDMPEKLRGVKPDGLPHSAWMLLEHLRLAQWDILEFSCNSKYQAPEWPKDYWPKTEAPPSAAAWNKSIQQFRKDLKSIQDLVANPKTDLFASIPWGCLLYTSKPQERREALPTLAASAEEAACRRGQMPG